MRKAPVGCLRVGFQHTGPGLRTAGKGKEVIRLEITVENGLRGRDPLPAGWEFEDGFCEKPMKTGDIFVHQPATGRLPAALQKWKAGHIITLCLRARPEIKRDNRMRL